MKTKTYGFSGFETSHESFDITMSQWN